MKKFRGITSLYWHGAGDGSIRLLISMQAVAVALMLSLTATIHAGEIVREGEGENFYATVVVPKDAETMYLSGSGASPEEDGNWGDMEQQTVNTFQKFKELLESRGWSMEDVVQVRAFAVAGADGELDFEGFNRGYQQFFGTDQNPQKPVRSFVQVAGLVVPGWLVEIEVRAARVP